MTDWREKLIEAMALQMERRQHGMRFEVASDNMLACARAALEVAEPVIRLAATQAAVAIANEHLADTAAAIVAAAIREGGKDE